MKFLKIFLVYFFISFSLLLSQTPNKNPDPAKLMEIKKLLKLVHADELPKSMFEEMLSAYKRMLVSVNESYWDSLRTDFMPEGTIDLMVPVYDKYFSLSEIRELIIFFETPTGKKWIGSFGDTNTEIIGILDKWASEVYKKLNERIKKDGYIYEHDENQK